MKNTTLENSKWLKVSQLKIGQKIAVLARPGAEIAKADLLNRPEAEVDGDILWDEIVSINPAGREQVYDIEVKGTHNFVGNDIFAHNTYLGGNVGIGNATPVAKLHINDSEETSFVVTSSGFVGIGTTTPAYKLSVAGDIAATAFVNISTRSSKIDIQYLSGDDEKNILEKIKSANVATYHYGLEDPANPKRLGLIAEEAPAEVLSIDGKGVDIYKLSSFILAGVKAQQMQIDQLTQDVAVIKSTLSSLGQPVSAPSTSSTLSTLSAPFKFIVTVAKTTLASIASTIGDWANGVLASTTKLKISSEDSENASYQTYPVLGSREEITASGSATLTMTTPTPETGSGQAGARIKFDESFVSVISETEPIKVIVTPTTRLNGALYVAQKSRFGFEVREVNAQDEGGMFDWLVIARKKGGEENGGNGTQGGEMAPAAQIQEPVTPISEPTPSAPISPEPISTPSPEPTPTEPDASVPSAPSVDSTSSLPTAPSEPAPVAEEIPAEPTPPPAEEVVAPSAEEIAPPAETVTPPPAEEPAPSEPEPITTP